MSDESLVTHEEYLSHMYHVRKENLRHLANENGGVIALSQMLGMSQGWVSQLLQGGTFSEKVARKLEEAAGLHYGWLDGLELEENEQ